MRHRQARHRLNRYTSWRKATVKSMASNILIYDRMLTTKIKAKAVKPLIDKLISLAKKNTLAAKRQAFQILCSHTLVSTLFNEIGPRFKEANGGYCRIIHAGTRRGDGAQMVMFELTVHKAKKGAAKAKKGKEEKPQTPADIQETSQQSPSAQQPKVQTRETTKGKPPVTQQKPSKDFLGGIRSIFRKKSDSL